MRSTMLAICYDSYSGTLGKFSRAEIFELVAEAGYEGINIPVNSAFLGDLFRKGLKGDRFFGPACRSI